MSRYLRHPLVLAGLAVATLAFLFFIGMGLYVASEAGQLPWQTDPTRIPITPFADIPGFAQPTPPPATPTPVATNVVEWQGWA